MKNYKSDSKYGAKKGARKTGRGSAKKSNGRSYRKSAGRNEMHEAFCAKCDKRCEVPFKPNNKKPVYCNNCYVKDGEPESKRFGDTPKKDLYQTGIKKSLDQLNIKLERIIEILESK